MSKITPSLNARILKILIEAIIVQIANTLLNIQLPPKTQKTIINIEDSPKEIKSIILIIQNSFLDNILIFKSHKD